MNKTVAARRLRGFIVFWITQTMPYAKGVKIDAATGAISVKDSLGWRHIGTVMDYYQVARALGHAVAF